ncbi:multidrug resistance-associated protein [Penicillium bovifimosum]|uniref:Multidrug resistance-associated protein n=1 Tax=Penicillium bovifimosum TaxID=126998 RepID=A0A9W9H0L0_9EURO|nr:multidrug resistance-associated protein [Penicillium bovifimosum]KAJ5135340.1 multidrug resistance-associated protein [Penicillium bovifimosum]
MAISTAIYWRLTYRLATMARAGLISIIYYHTTELHGSDVKDTSALTLMGTDVERIVESLKSLHETWASIIEVAVALFLLERQIFLACLVPACICFACASGAGPVSTRTAPAQKAWVERIQIRLAVTSAFLGNMKAVKMLGLKEPLFGLVTKLREAELKTSSRFRRLLVWTVERSLLSGANIPSDFAPYATFAAYAIISVARNDQSLLASQAFTSLSLISLLTAPLLAFVQAVPALFESKGCFERIEVYLAIPTDNYKNPRLVTKDMIVASQQRAMELTSGEIQSKTGAGVISFKDVNISWSVDTEPVLKNLTLDIKRGITVVVGPVGSGKSALIAGILGEIIHQYRMLLTVSRRLGLSTIRLNTISPGGELDPKWYEFCVSASGLEDDLKAMPGGSMYVAGSDGVSLSGGQKQRVALARAIYSRLPIILLDDPFSGLDSRCIGHISSTLFARDGYFRESGKTVILATHNRTLLPFADEVIVLNDGNVVDSGTSQEILIANSEIAVKSLMEPETEQCGTGQIIDDRKEICGGTTQEIQVQDKNDTKKPDFSRRDGSWQVYAYYVRSAGTLVACLFIASFIVSTFLSKFSTIWIRWWSDSNAKAPNAKVGFYLGIYTAFTVLSISCFVLGCYLLFINIINETAFGLHADLLRATLEAPFSFFQVTDSGSITNRFSQDIDLIDMKLPAWVVNTVANGSQTIINLVIFCAVGKYMAAFFPVLILAFFLIQSYYLRTSRQMRLLDIEAKAPLYTTFTETLKGVVTIKAFGWQKAFLANCQRQLNDSQKPFYTLLCIQEWLNLVLSLVVAAMAVILLAITTSFRDKFSGGVMGVALNLILTLNQSLVRTIQSWTQLETSIGAVSRVQAFQKNTPSEANIQSPHSSPVDEWLSEGRVSLKDVSVFYHSKRFVHGYRPGEENCNLRAVREWENDPNHDASPNGRNQNGHVLIDGKNLASLEPNDIRIRLNVIPQEPFFVPGKLRFNLDFHGKFSDENIESAIRKVGLWKRVSAGGGLDMPMIVSDWSAGEKQLLALARALNIQSPILILDEATSRYDFFFQPDNHLGKIITLMFVRHSVDWETESTMQRVIDAEFTKQTIIAVVHRHRFIDRYDRVALLKSGELIEYDDPFSLLRRRGHGIADAERDEGFYAFYIFAGINFLLAIFVCFFIPGTKQVPLEEIDTLFGGANHVAQGQEILAQQKGAQLEWEGDEKPSAVTVDNVRK